MEPKWLSIRAILLIHEEQLREHGGAAGLKDPGLLESAMMRPVNRRSYGASDVAALATSYAFGIIRNHPFVDGNKRTGFMAAYTFLGLNGHDLVAPDAEVVVATLGLASGEIDEPGYAAWIRDRISL